MATGISKLLNRRAIVFTLLLALVVYVGLAVSSEVSGQPSVWGRLRWQYVAGAFALSFVNYSLRFCNWQFYLSSLGLRSVPRLESLLIFIGGFALGVTPGKVGEVVRSVLLKERHGIPASRTGSIIVVDRLTDVLALLLIAGVGVLKFQYGLNILALLSAASLGLLILLSSRRLSHGVLRMVKRVPGLRSRESQLERLYDSTYTLLQPRRLWVIMLISLCSWSCEAVGFYLIFQALGLSIALPYAFFIYSFSTLLGAISFLPGGLGLTEGSMTGLLILLQVTRETAAAATVLIRLATLWFGLGLGILCLTILESRPKVVQIDSKPGTIE